MEYTIFKHRSQLLPFICKSIRFVISKDTGTFKSIEVTYATAFLHPPDITFHICLTFRQLLNTVDVSGDIERSIPLPVLRADNITGNSYFKASVTHFTDIGFHICKTGFFRQLVVCQQTVCIFIVIIGSDCQTAIPEIQVQTKVELFSFLPFQIVFTDTSRNNATHSVINRIRRIRVDIVVVADCFVTRDTETCTDLTIFEKLFRKFHEFLIREAPSHRYGREITPFVLFGKTRRTVTTHNGIEQISSFIIISHTGKNGSHRVIA